ncbi:MAG: tRNA dihydrouridine(20/20a) synthase DusA [Pseudomonadota bacterium]
MNAHAFSVAPMMELTDRHCRYFHRLLSGRALLYSEMVTCNAIIHGDRDYLLGFGAQESPVVLQLGGCDPQDLATCAKIGQQYGYAEINLNVGCPSDRVRSGRFGACLMAEPGLVAQCVAAMQDAVDIPVTVKCRVGIDRNDAYEPFFDFVSRVHEGGCQMFVVHARKAWLDGLSPTENRVIPPLRYDFVHRIKQQLPDVGFVVNGGIDSHAQALDLLKGQSVTLDGVMLGRAAYRNPYLLSVVDQLYYGSTAASPDRFEVAEQLLAYIDHEVAGGVRLGHITRHVLGLFQGQPGGRLWRRHLSENAWQPGAGSEVVVEALDIVKSAARRTAA